MGGNRSWIATASSVERGRQYTSFHQLSVHFDRLRREESPAAVYAVMCFADVEPSRRHPGLLFSKALRCPAVVYRSAALLRKGSWGSLGRLQYVSNGLGIICGSSLTCPALLAAGQGLILWREGHTGTTSWQM